MARARNYFLNEQHELLPENSEGFAPPVTYLHVDWRTKGKRLQHSLERVSTIARASRDPISKRRYYLVASPEESVSKASEAQDAVGGEKIESVSFRGEGSKIFERLGLDLIEVHPNGAATVHALPERMEQLQTRTSQLGQAGIRDQGRFVAIQDFDWLPAAWKFDKEWTATLTEKPVEAYIKLQPLLNEIEADLVIRTLDNFFAETVGGALRGKGRSYLGRYFLRALLDANAVQRLAETFMSIQSIHPPIIALAEALPAEITSTGKVISSKAPTITSLPTVGIVDTAIPSDHVLLRPYRRGSPILGLNCSNTENDNHGSMVASRVVFGHLSSKQAMSAPRGTCRFLEVRVGRGFDRQIQTEAVSGAITAAIMAAPDVRIFNLSFDGERRLDDLPARQRAETLKHIEELDNLAFDQDVLFVVAAGNVPQAVIPVTPYPNHLNETAWELHSYSRAFNALTCGGIIPHLSAGGLGAEPNAPSPFTRIGPGFARSPKPDFCASAGNTDMEHRRLPGAGVWGFSALGDPREDWGTSFASPLLAREAAYVLDFLRQFCPGDTRLFACTVKAILASIAEDIAGSLSENLRPLGERTLGYGRCDADRMRRPQQQTARFVWQGVINAHDEIARVQLPIPSEWLTLSSAPRLRLCVAWDTPVSAAAEDQWACRNVEVKLHRGPEFRAVHGSRGRVAGYPLFERWWDLKKADEKFPAEGDLWILTFSYSQIASYAAGHAVSDSQRIGLAAEIWDAGETSEEPHAYLQALDIAPTFSRLSNTAVWMSQPITITTDF